MTNNWASYFTN